MYHEMSLSEIFQQVMARVGAMSGQQSTAVLIVVGLNLILFGVGLSVFGAKLARSSFASILLVVGGVLGAVIGRNNGMSLPLSAGIGAGVGLIAGLALFRLWVGVAAGVLFAIVGTGIVGYQQVWPTAKEFDHARYFNTPVARASVDPADIYSLDRDSLHVDNSGNYSVKPGAVQLSTGSLDIDKGQVAQTLTTWASDLWSYLQSHIENLNAKFGGLALGIGLLGLVLGLLFPTLTAVVTTAAIGTAMLVTGLGVCAWAGQPDAYLAAVSNPTIIGAVIGALFTGSVILQGLLSRKGKSEKVVAIPTV